VYQRDAKIKTLIFPDVQVGDTLVYVTRTHHFDKRLGEHFVYSALLSQSLPLTSYRLEVLAPVAIDLNVHLQGEGFSHVVADESGVRRHLIGFAPKPWRQDEPDAVSVWDREPRITITTFKSMEQLAAAYWRHMQGKDVVTAEIQSLADDITRGIDDRRAQVSAIDHWVKRNIRYVMVYLGAGGFTPNPAFVVLKNRYGDCKDHAVLMSALLKAKNIASEQVLILMGNSYRLAALPMPEFNHAMLYIPELSIYTDPTASTASLGVLPTGSYDKPVLHVADTGSRVARTPPMRSEDHVSMSTTRMTVDANGSIRGTTREVLTGTFASTARQIAAKIERTGPETFAADKLRSQGHPGTGTFIPANPFDYSEPYVVEGSFALTDKLQMPLEGLRDTPSGMLLFRRPGYWPFGARLADRKTNFPCFAAKQVEKIEIEFAEGLPLPKPFTEVNIGNRHFAYTSISHIEGRTLKIRREFVSTVVSQQCTPEIEADIGEPLQRVVRNLKARMKFANERADRKEAPSGSL